jgi:hypothetical protein
MGIGQYHPAKLAEYECPESPKSIHSGVFTTFTGLNKVFPLLKTLSLSLVCAFLLLSFSGCQKYPDGPLLSLRTKAHRMCENWKRVKEYENGTDITSTAMSHIYSESRNIFMDGTFSYNLSTDNGSVSYSGTWVFSTDKTIVNFAYVVGTTNVNETFLILRLKEGDMWLRETTFSGDIYEYHFAPN